MELDAAAVPAVFLEVTPVVLLQDDDDDNCYNNNSILPPAITNFGVKEYLRRQTQEAAARAMVVGPTDDRLFLHWDVESSEPGRNSRLGSGYLVPSMDTTALDDDLEDCYESAPLPLIQVPSEDPTVVDPQPCCVTAYAYRSPYRTSLTSPILVTDDTLMRILPFQVARLSAHDASSGTISSYPACIRQVLFLQDLSGEAGNDFLTEAMQEEVLQNHNPETAQELHYKMANVLKQPIQIGTAPFAFRNQKHQLRQMRKMQQSLFAYHQHQVDSAGKISSHTTSIHDDADQVKTSKQKSELFWWPSLLVHSPNHADGKTLLVQAIAKNLGCTLIHIIRSGVLLAKYGGQADAALETQLHAILVSAACRNQKVCILLDNIDMMMPPRLSGRSSASDAALPVLTAMASYLRNVTSSMQRLHQFPYPIKNALYNVGAGNGHVLTVQCCLVGIVTCPDDGWKSVHRSEGMGGGGGEATILDCMICDRYRIPLRTAETRLSAFLAAFRREGIQLDSLAHRRLPNMAASAAWAKGKAFRAVAQHLKYAMSTEQNRDVSLQQVERAFASVKNDSSSFTNVTFESVGTTSSSDMDSMSFFKSVGGNAQAKASLEDALALDPFKRTLLAKFGLSPPTGVLLYGPPGCGKTLLAKAVANLLKSPGSGGDDAYSTSRGGTFISLAISDIVSAELGTSEKMIKSCFDFAEKNAPSVIFLDEFQALFVDRNRGGSGRLTTTLLQCLDDVKRWYDVEDRIRVTVIAATNTPWMIDTAFLRPGRFDRVVHVGLPTTEERQSILHLHMNCMKIRGRENKETIIALCQNLAGQTDGFSGADLAALCRAAAVRALFDASGKAEVREIHFTEALETDVSPSSDDDLVQRLSKWRP